MASLKRSATKASEDTYKLPEGIDSEWQRLGLVLYNDHASEYFHRAAKAVIGDSFIDWFNAKRRLLKDKNKKNKDDDSFETNEDKNSDSEEKEDEEEEEDEDETDELPFTERFTEPDNVVLDVMYAVPYITVKVWYVIPHRHQKTIILSYAKSKRYELQVAEERLSGKIHGDPERREAFNQQLDSLRYKSPLKEEQILKYKQVLLDLKCDKVATAYSWWGECTLGLEWGQKTTPASRNPVYRFDDQRAFFTLIQHDRMDPDEKLKWADFWKAWKE